MKFWTDKYREAGEEYGTSDKLSVVLLRDGWVADSLEEVEKVWWPVIRAEHWFYFEKVPRWVADLEPFIAGIKQEEDFVFDQHHVDPGRLAEQQRLARAARDTAERATGRRRTDERVG